MSDQPVCLVAHEKCNLFLFAATLSAIKEKVWQGKKNSIIDKLKYLTNENYKHIGESDAKSLLRRIHWNMIM